MKITPFINSYNFKSNNRLVATERKTQETVEMNMAIRDLPLNYDLHYSNFTVFFRNDLNGMFEDWCEFDNWNDFIQLLHDRYNNTPKVNTYCFACFDGSEAYSLTMDLMDKLGNEGEKFFPIKACDIDNHIIQIAKSGRIPCCERDIDKFNLNLRSFKDYARLEREGEELYFIPKEETASKVQFECKNVLDTVDEIEPSNSIVMARNFIPYLKNEDIELFAQKLAQNLDNTSLLVTGRFDMKSMTWQMALNKYFYEIYPLVYVKKVSI